MGGPYMWLLFSIITWFLMGALIHYIWSRKNRTEQGITTLRISYNRKVHAKRLQEFMLYVTIWYNRLMAKPDLVLSADELQTRIEKEFEDQKLWNDEEFELQNRKEDLAVD